MEISRNFRHPIFFIIIQAITITFNWASTTLDQSNLLVPVLLVSPEQENQLDNHTTQLVVPVNVNNGTVVIGGQELETDETININILVPLQLISPDGRVLSSAIVTAEARVVVVESRLHGLHVLRMQILVTSIDSHEVIAVSLPEVNIFLSDDGNESKRSFQLIKTEISLLATQQESVNTESIKDSLDFVPVVPNLVDALPTLETAPDMKALLFRSKHENQQKAMETDQASLLCRGCSVSGCLRPDPLLCTQLPPAMRLAICAVLFCLAAFLLMLFVHVFILRPTTSVSSLATSRYARNLRMAWAYAPLLPEKEPCV